MNWDDINNAVQQARETRRVVSSHSSNMARLLIGNLREVSDKWVLKELKRELQAFDSTKKRWNR